MTKKITDLVHAGKYAEAQRLTDGLLVAYPDDQRLIKAKALIDKMLAPGNSSGPASVSREPVQPEATSNTDQLSGMDKVDYNGLMLLARQAQQTTDLDEQKNLLRQFMAQSTPFLQKHPGQTLLWQLRAASAISLNEPNLGYEAGQKLLDAGAANSNDPALQNLLGQLKNKGWLEKQQVEDLDKYGWLLGTWSVSWSGLGWPDKCSGFGYCRTLVVNGSYQNEIFTKSGKVIEGYEINSAGMKSTEPIMRGTILDSGEIQWERYYFLEGRPPYIRSRSIFIENDKAKATSQGKAYPFYPSSWQPVVSSHVDEHKSTMTMVVPSQAPLGDGYVPVARIEKQPEDFAKWWVKNWSFTMTFTRVDSTH
ncbi:MAG: hypothetical protein ABR976_10495 [Terracidiphilus sp.]